MDIPKRDDNNDLPGSDRVLTTDSDVIDLGPIDNPDLPVATPFGTGPAVARAARPKSAAKKRAKAAKKSAAKKKGVAKKAGKKKAGKKKAARKKAAKKSKGGQKAKKKAKKR
jgi:hypothetical protein